jgi:hypothetical protein
MYLLNAIDSLTRRVKAVPLCNMEASPYTDTLTSEVAGSGMPTTVTADRGTQFTFALWTSECKRLGIQQRLTTSYQPQRNSMVKCLHRQIKVALCACGAGLVWHSHLPRVLLGLHAVPKEGSMVSSAELVLGHTFLLPCQLLHVPDRPHVDMAPLPMEPASYAAAADSPPAHLARVEYMYLRVGGKQKQLARPKCQPIQGAGQGGRIQIGQKAKIVSVDDLKHHTAPMDPAEATCLSHPRKQPATFTVQPATS